MAWLKGIRKDGIILIDDDIDFRGSIIGAGGMKAIPPKRAYNYYVDKLNGSDTTHSGKSWDGAYATIAKAITVANATINWSSSPWADNHVIHIAPGVYAENITSFPLGATILGYGDSWDLDGENGVVIKPATGTAVDCTSIINSVIWNLAFMQVATAGALFQVDNFNRNTLGHCVFAGIPGTSPTTTRGFEVVKDMTGSRLLDCFFMQCKTGVYINTDNANSKQISGTIFDRITIACAETAGFHFDINSNPAGVYVLNSNVGDNSAILALGMDDDTDQVTVANTNFWATANDPASGGTYYNNCYLNGALIT